MDNRILLSERIKQEVQWVLRGQEAAGHPLDRLVHLGAQYLLQRALEEGVQEFLGRGYYRHGGTGRGWRNWYEPKRVKTPVGVLTTNTRACKVIYGHHRSMEVFSHKCRN